MPTNIVKENSSQLSAELTIDSAHRDIAIRSMNAALNDDDAAEKFIKDFSNYEIAIAPIAGWTMYFQLEGKVRNLMSSFNVAAHREEKAEYWAAKAKEILDGSLNDIMSGISDEVLPRDSSRKSYDVAREVFAENPAKAKLAISKIIKDIMVHPSFEKRAVWIANQVIGMEEKFRKIGEEQTVEHKIQIALRQAQQQRIKDSERLIINMDALNPASAALIKYFDYTLENAENLLNGFNQAEESLVPVIARFLNTKVNNWVSQLNLQNDTHNFEQALDDINPESRSCCVHYGPYTMMFKDNMISQVKLDHLATQTVTLDMLKSSVLNVFQTMLKSNGFYDEVQIRVLGKGKLLNKRYDVHNTSVAEQDAYNAKLLSSRQIIADIGARRLANPQQHFLNELQGLVTIAAPAALITLCCAAALWKMRAKPLQRMGGFLSNAISSGITFMSVRNNPQLANVDVIRSDLSHVYEPVARGEGEHKQPGRNRR